MIVAPHPDDELLVAGGLLAMRLARGGRVLVIGVTDGEASHPHADGQRLAQRRRLERAHGLSLMDLPAGCTERLGLPDGAVAAHGDRLRLALGPLLKPDDLVVTTWEHDGHPDHDATGAAVGDVARPLGCRLLTAPVWMWHWCAPGDRRVPWQRMRALALGSTLVDKKGVALAAHASQLEPRDDLGPVLDAAIMDRAARSAEYYFLD